MCERPEKLFHVYITASRLRGDLFADVARADGFGW